MNAVKFLEAPRAFVGPRKMSKILFSEFVQGREMGNPQTISPLVNHKPKFVQAKTIITRTKGQLILPFAHARHWETHLLICWHTAPTFSHI